MRNQLPCQLVRNSAIQLNCTTESKPGARTAPRQFRYRTATGVTKTVNLCLQTGYQRKALLFDLFSTMPGGLHILIFN